jgi:3-hydroxyisobutyrate dehydrogenase-like beta-hydroxyacid dehydrogenase
VPDLAATATRIGFVGLGRMGANMAARFLAAGYAVYGEERNREHAQHLVDEGLRWCETPQEVAEAAEIVFASISDDRVLEEVDSGPDGSLTGLAPGKMWIDVSTVTPQASREVAARVRAQGTRARDAPASAEPKLGASLRRAPGRFMSSIRPVALRGRATSVRPRDGGGRQEAR